MKRTLSILVVILLAASVASVTPVMAQGVPYPGGSGAPAEAKQIIEGKIKSVEGGLVTLEDGTKLMIPASVRVQRDALKEGAVVKASYEDRGGLKVVTSIEVQ